MTLSIFTTATNPGQRGDTYHQSLACYRDLADEVVVVNGGQQITTSTNVRMVNRKWPIEFNWRFIGQQFQRGYEACVGDWVIHADLDFFFHEKDFDRIRQACEQYSDAPALTFIKYQFIIPDRYNIKSRLVLAVNKGKFGDRIRFDSGGDLCQPSLDGEYITPDQVPQTQIPFYNYEKLLKTKEQVKDDMGRMERAHYTHFGEYMFDGGDGSDEQAYKGWLQMVTGRFTKPQKYIDLYEHPKYIQETLKQLKPEQWGYSGFDLLGRNSYV